jgi:hypothetical protein
MGPDSCNHNLILSFCAWEKSPDSEHPPSCWAHTPYEAIINRITSSNAKSKNISREWKQENIVWGFIVFVLLTLSYFLDIFILTHLLLFSSAFSPFLFYSHYKPHLSIPSPSLSSITFTHFYLFLSTIRVLVLCNFSSPYILSSKILYCFSVDNYICTWLFCCLLLFSISPCSFLLSLPLYRYFLIFIKISHYWSAELSHFSFQPHNTINIYYLLALALLTSSSEDYKLR